MRDTNNLPDRYRDFVVPHELVDAYWYAEMLRHRAARIATDAGCKSTIGRRLESSLGRVTGAIVEAADGAPEKAKARLARARSAIGLSLSHFNDLVLKAGIGEAMLIELRERAALLLERIEMLENEPVEKWPASNCLPAVVAEVITDDFH